MSKSPKTSRQIARELYDKQQKKLDAAEKNLDAASKEITELKGQLSSYEQEIHLLLERIKLLVLKLAHAENRPEQMALKLELKSLQEQLSRHATEKFGSSRSERRRRTGRWCITPTTGQSTPQFHQVHSTLTDSDRPRSRQRFKILQPRITSTRRALSSLALSFLPMIVWYL